MADPIAPPITPPEPGGTVGDKPTGETDPRCKKADGQRKTMVMRVCIDKNGKVVEKKLCQESDVSKAKGGDGKSTPPKGPGEPITQPPVVAPVVASQRIVGNSVKARAARDAAASGGGSGSSSGGTCPKQCRYWVDLELLKGMTLRGAQWAGPSRGNQSQSTILQLACDLTGNAGLDKVCVRVAQGKEPMTDVPPECVPEKKDVPVRLKQCTKSSERGGNVERSFKNQSGEGGNDCRKGCGVHVRFNNIDDEYLDDGRPPADPKEYKDAIKRTDDHSDYYMPVEIEKEFQTRRGKGIGRQAVHFKNMWGSEGKCNVDTPGSLPSGKSYGKILHVRLDPHQKLINFGPDGLAVEFEGKKSAAPEGGGGGGGGGGGEEGTPAPNGNGPGGGTAPPPEPAPPPLVS